MAESADKGTTPDPKPGPIEAMCFPRFANAAAHACVFELQARLLADKDDALRSGDRAEQVGIDMLRDIAAVAPVPREEDFGIDAIATILENHGGESALR